MVEQRRSTYNLPFVPDPLAFDLFNSEQTRYLLDEFSKIARSLENLQEVGLVTKTSSYNVRIDESIIFINTASGAVTATLPLATRLRDKKFLIKCIDATNTCSISPSGSDTIDGSTSSITLLAYEFIEVVSDGTNWHIIRDNR